MVTHYSPPPGSPRPSRACEPGEPAATASACSTCCSPRASTSGCARWPRPRPRTGSWELMQLDVEGVEVDVADALEQLGGPGVGQRLGGGQTGRASVHSGRLNGTSPYRTLEPASSSGGLARPRGPHRPSAGAEGRRGRAQGPSGGAGGGGGRDRRPSAARVGLFAGGGEGCRSRVAHLGAAIARRERVSVRAAAANLPATATPGDGLPPPNRPTLQLACDRAELPNWSASANTRCWRRRRSFPLGDAPAAA